jgi:hypothetical protein
MATGARAHIWHDPGQGDMERTTLAEAQARTLEPDTLDGTEAIGFHVPVEVQGVVLIAGLDAKLERSRVVAEMLHQARIGTLDLALALPRQEATPSHAALLSMAQRVVAAADWVASRPEAAGLPLGVFGSDVAGGAALAAAAIRPHMFRAVVSRAGRPELAGSTLDEVRAATLLIVAGHDDPSIASHQEAMARVRGIAELEIIPGTSDSLDEPDATAQVARLTRRWFTRFLL